MGVVDWQLYIIQEYCDGGSLFDAIRARRFWDAGTKSPCFSKVRAAGAMSTGV
jgi:serine/threonine protein kinase